MGLSERLSRARSAIVKAFGSGGGEDAPRAGERTLHHVEGAVDEEARIAKMLFAAFRDQVVKQGKAVQRQAVFSGKQGLYPPIDFNIFDQMHEQTSWVRAVVGVITKAVTAKGWALRPLRPDADPARADELKAFFSNPNPQDTLVEILDDITRDCFVFGNAFTEVVYGAQGRPRELWTLDAPTLRLRVDEHGLILGYIQAQIGQQEIGFEPREVMHFKLGTKGASLFGLSPLASLILPVTVDKFAQVYNRAFFLNGAKVRGAFIMKDSTPEQVERNREYLKERAKDLDLAHSDLILEGAVEVKQVGTTQKDMEFLSLREFTRNEILAVYGVPPAMVSIIETGNIGAGTGETQRQNFYEETIAPFQYRVAEKITKQVIRGGFGYDDWAFEFNRRTIDEKEQAEILNIYLQAGVLKPEEVRPIVLSRLPEIRKAMGARETSEEMVKALRGAAETITDATRAVIQLENRFLESLRGHFGKLAQAMEARLPSIKASAVRSAVETAKAGFQEAPIAHGILRFIGWTRPEALKAVPELEALLEVVDAGEIARIIQRFSLEAARKGLGVSARRSKVEEPDDISRELEEAVKKNAVVVAANVSESIKSSIRRELVAGIEANETIPQLQDRIAAKLESFVTVQVKGATDAAGNVIQSPYERAISNADAAEIIARTEANRAYNLGTLDALEQNDVQEVTFLLASDACPVCREIAQSAPGSKVGRKFSIEEARNTVPIHPNCRCTWIVEGA
ncbi:MAG: phage portal protein [Elusimicrobiota bacterium]